MQNYHYPYSFLSSTKKCNFNSISDYGMAIPVCIIPYTSFLSISNSIINSQKSSFEYS